MTAAIPRSLPLDVALKQAIANHQAGRLHEAERLYRAILQTQPYHPDANHNLGVLAGQVGQHAVGLPYLKTALAINPSKGQYALSYAEALLLTGQTKEALDILQTARKHGLNSPAAQALRRRAEVAALNSAANGEAPTPAEMSQLVALFNAGRHAELEGRTRLLVEQYPDSGFAWKVLGASLKAQGKEALPALHKATELLPDDAAARYNLGTALEALGQLDGAVASYRRALEIKPDFAEAHCNLGAVLQALGQLDGAAASYRRALEIKPDLADAHNNLGSALEALGQLDGAVASYRRALEINPDFAEAHCNLGAVLQAVGQLDGAVASYRRALEIKPDYAEAYGNLGGVLKAQGKLDDALACFQQQFRLMPKNGEAQHHIASLTRNNTERAPIQYVEKVFDGYADKFDTHLLQVLKYEAPERLVALVTQHSTPPAEKWNVLDLGCGTGLVGLAIAPFARQLVGVDLSPKMLEKARARNIYQRLERADLLTMMQGEKASSYDVIVAADVFIYIGKLDEVIGEIKRLLCPDGVFAFSIEALGTLSNEEASRGAQQEYQLENTGRYTHSANHITRLASANGFLSMEMAATQIRTEHDKPVNGYLVLWKS